VSRKKLTAKVTRGVAHRPGGAVMVAYHFVGATLRDGRPVPPDGEWLVHDGPVVMCESGLHASRRPFDALSYAPGPVLCEVEVEDIVGEESDKLVARRRRIVRRLDATDLLRSFARSEALRVEHLWDCPAVVREYLETGDETIRVAASDAAGVAPWTAWAAAWAAAGGAARGAAEAARDAAWAAASDAAGVAAWAAARAAAWAAARGAPWGTAQTAARAAAGDRFDALVEARFAAVR